jgi:hypothetical protein
MIKVIKAQLPTKIIEAITFKEINPTTPLKMERATC